MPSFKEVAEEFYSKYSFTGNESFLRFYRKKEGWFIAEEKFENLGHYVNSALFWSRETQSFLSMDYPFSNDETALKSEAVNRYLQQIDWSYEEYPFSRNIYYGYPGWDWDIIREFSDSKPDNDTLFESLGRAFSSYASVFITDQYGSTFINDDPDRVPLKPSEKFGTSRIKKFISYELKAIDAFKRLKEISPGYETRVGNISIKLANEYMYIYSDLMMAGDYVNALKFADKAVYPDSLLKLSRSFLSSVPQNSILITAGDNDTYPLWYIQEIQKFRRDVIVLNYSLLGLSNYLSMIARHYSHKVFSTTENIYFDKSYEYTLFHTEKDTSLSISVKAFLNHLIKNYNPFNKSHTSPRDGSQKEYYSKSLFFANAKGVKSKTIKLGNYLLLNDFMLLDILNTNLDRNVYFTFKNDFMGNTITPKGVVFKTELWNK